jgi:hypothetical protein
VRMQPIEQLSPPRIGQCFEQQIGVAHDGSIMQAFTCMSRGAVEPRSPTTQRSARWAIRR